MSPIPHPVPEQLHQIVAVALVSDADIQFHTPLALLMQRGWMRRFEHVDLLSTGTPVPVDDDSAEWEQKSKPDRAGIVVTGSLSFTRGETVTTDPYSALEASIRGYHLLLTAENGDQSLVPAEVIRRALQSEKKGLQTVTVETVGICGAIRIV